MPFTTETNFMDSKENGMGRWRTWKVELIYRRGNNLTLFQVVLVIVQCTLLSVILRYMCTCTSVFYVIRTNHVLLLCALDKWTFLSASRQKGFEIWNCLIPLHFHFKPWMIMWLLWLVYKEVSCDLNIHIVTNQWCDDDKQFQFPIGRHNHVISDVLCDLKP